MLSENTQKVFQKSTLTGCFSKKYAFEKYLPTINFAFMRGYKIID
jgi:hypothetical protein